ncbi:Ankyrin-1 [Dactylella cylindrospora]|nr:Ankyrin-1 [Dactylella cylindrospora]
MDVVGSVASLVTTAIVLVNYGKDVKGAPQEWIDTSDQVMALKALLEEYVRVNQSASTNSEKSVYRHIEPLVPQIERLFGELQKQCPTKSRGLKKLWKQTAWPVFPKKEAEDILTKLHRLQSSLQLAITEDVQSITLTILDYVEADRIRAWLESSFDKEQPENHNRFLSPVVPGTGLHLLQCDKYHRWLVNKDSGVVFWCHGVPGAGKSTQLSVVLHDLQSKWTEQNATQPLAGLFFYISADTVKDLTAEKVIRTLLLQLLNLIASKHARPGKRLFPKPIIELEARYAKFNLIPPLQELTKAFIESTQYPEFSAGILVAIDNLHLLPMDDNPKLIEDMRYMLTNFQESHNIKLLICDRNASVDAFLEDSENSWLYELAASKSDLEIYLNHKMESKVFQRELERDKRWRKQAITELIIEKSDKSFLLPELQMRELLRPYNSKSVSAILKALPQRFLDIYRADLLKVAELPPDKSLFAKKAISWVYFARRQLSAYELQCAVNFGSPDVDDPDSPTIDIQLIIQWCQGLLRYIETPNPNIRELGPVNSPKVRFVHDTVFELLRIEPGLVSAIEGDIATECINYLENIDLTEIASDDLSSRGRAESKARKYGLLSYSTEMWGFHASRSEMVRVDKLALDLLQQESKLQLSLDAIPKGCQYSDTDIATATSLDIAAHFDYVRLGEILVTEGLAEINPTAIFSFDIVETPKTPLMWAIISDSESFAKWLISNGAEINVRVEGWSALHWAVSLSRTKMVELLLSNGAEVDTRSDYKQTPLILAAIRGLPDISKLLTNYGANINACDSEYKAPIHHAAEQGHLALLQWLVDSGADFNAKAAGNRTPLSFAASSGRSELVSYLLSLGPPMEEITSALDWSVRGGHVGVVWSLLEAGADCNHEFRDWDTLEISEISSAWTSLQRASYRGNLPMMKLLLTYGADMYATAGGEFTSKDWAEKGSAGREDDGRPLALLHEWERAQKKLKS